MPEQDPNPQEPRIVVDEDWKERVAAEREALRKQEEGKEQAAPEATSSEEAPADAGQDQVQLPPASFSILISTLATQALLHLGQIPDPTQEGRQVFNLPLAKHHIDMLEVLEEKTRGNLQGDEQAMLQNVLHELRMAFVQVRKAVTKS